MDRGTRLPLLALGCIWLILFLLLFGNGTSRQISAVPRPSQSAEATLFVDGTDRFQTIDGFGVNANGASWDNGALAPALDTLADTLGVHIWRVILEETNWETVNDNADPDSFNWDYYTPIYESPKFASLWSIIAYLNQKGQNEVMLNMMGAVPTWMGDGVIDEAAEDEWVEMITSVVSYGRNVKKLDFQLLSPTNEIDLGPPEGPRVDPTQYARLINKLTVRLEELGLTDIRLVPPDIAFVDRAEDYLTPLFADPAIMARVQHVSFHDYGGNSGAVDRLIKQSAYPDRNFWMSEFSAQCQGCDTGNRNPDQWAFGDSTVDLLLRHLEQGAAAALIYEAYDSYYEHHGSFGYWGLLAYDDATRTYAPTKRFYASSQVITFTRPGMVRVGVTSSNSSLQVVAFSHPTTGAVTIVGRNSTSTALTLQGTLANLPPLDRLAVYQTTLADNLRRGEDVAVDNNTFSAVIDSFSIFTLTTIPFEDTTDTQAPAATMTAPLAGAVVAGNAVPVTALVSDNVGVANVQFFLDDQPLGPPIAAAPYTTTWDTTTTADGEHTLSAQARDAANNVGTANPVRVVVANKGVPPAARLLVGHPQIAPVVDENPPGMAEAFQYTAVADGTADSLAIYLDESSVAARVVVGIYSNGPNDTPGQLLTQATIAEPVSGAWNTVAAPPAPISQNTSYWIAVLGPVDTGIVRFRDVASGDAAQTSAQPDLATLPATWTPGMTYASSPLSAYAAQGDGEILLPVLTAKTTD